MKNNIKSSKAKGRRLQNWVRDKLREYFPSLEDDDIKSQTMGMTGEDIVLSPAAKKLIPYSFECKNQERLQVWKALQQAEDNSEDRTPVLVMKRNHSNTYAIIPFNKLMELIDDR
tara:strand:- start:735 stop:1079 length:345 start_codon:yes stop_codon:yes gene_type:complete